VPAAVTHPRIAATDSVSLAADVILPVVVPEGGVPVVLIQTRYWRSFALRGGGKKGVVPLGPREAIVERLVQAGFGVVVTDVRGTGASDGVWPWPWSVNEVRDMGPVIDWIVAQRWSNGRVGATGVSYEGTTALLSAAAGRPALRAVLAREVEWNLVDEIIAPGGVRNVGFVDTWSRSVNALDHGKLPELFPPLARLGIKGVQPTDDDPRADMLRARQRARQTTDVAGRVQAVRAGKDRFGADGPASDSLGPVGHVARLASSTAVVGIWGSWWDGATADAVLRAQEQMPIREAVIGPWSHEGDHNASPLRRDDSERPTVDLDAVVGFFRRHLTARDTASAPRNTWYVAGSERWRSGATWPSTKARTWHLVDTRLAERPSSGAARSLSVDFASSTGTKTRWTTGLARPVDAPNRADARGVISWHTAALATPLSVFGAAQFRCPITLDAPEAALHVYVESVDPKGRVRLLSEGVQRVQAGPVSVRIRPVAFELPVGWSLRLSVAGADTPSFERVPQAGPQRIHFGIEGCELSVPVVVDE
jgi:putative CocE/NonD family hydrolase